MSEATTPMDPTSNPGQPRIVVFGIGNAGCNALVNLARSGMAGVR